jgi:hypothetical protein
MVEQQGLLDGSAPTLEFANIFNAGIVHSGSHFLIFLFLSNFFSKIGIYYPDLVEGGLFWSLTQWEGGV